MSMIEIKGLKKSFGDLEVLKNIDQNVEEGEEECYQLVAIFHFYALHASDYVH